MHYDLTDVECSVGNLCAKNDRRVMSGIPAAKTLPKQQRVARCTSYEEYRMQYIDYRSIPGLAIHSRVCRRLTIHRSSLSMNRMCLVHCPLILFLDGLLHAHWRNIMLATALTSIADPLSPLAPPPANRPMRLDILAHRLITSIVRSYNSKQHVFWEGDPAFHVYKIEAGHVCIYRMIPKGRRQVIDFAYPGDVIGLGALNEHSANAQATTKTRVRCVPISVFHDAVRQDSRLGLQLYEAVSRELVTARELLCTISQRSAGERLAAFLIALSRRNQRYGEGPTAIRLPMTRGDIADFLGLTIETVSRTFTKFRMEGLIDLQQSVLVTIRDAHALADLAEGQHRVGT